VRILVQFHIVGLDQVVDLLALEGLSGLESSFEV
jgi:hypothetical protein